MDNQLNKLPKALDVKVFVPSKDFAISIDFYTQLGWKLNWQYESDLAELELANVRFYLQNFYHKKWAENFMLYIPVEDAHAWYLHAGKVIQSKQFAKAKTQKPKQEDHALVTYVWDPSGVLLHFAE